MSNFNYQIHELLGENEPSDSSSTVLVNRALLARIEMLESENLRLREGDSRERKYLRLMLSNIINLFHFTLVLYHLLF